MAIRTRYELEVLVRKSEEICGPDHPVTAGFRRQLEALDSEVTEPLPGNANPGTPDDSDDHSPR